MKPFLLNWHEIVLPSYTFMVMIASLAATWFACKVAERRGLNVIYILDIAILAIIAGFLGARIAHVVIERPDYYLEHPIRFFYFWQGGFVSFGDYVAIIISSIAYLKWRKAPVWLYMDVIGFAAPIAIFIGRIGCLLAGCCFGKPTDLGWHLTFTNPASTAYFVYPNIPLVPTQIYLMLHQVIIWLILGFFYLKRWRFQGQLICLMIILYAPGRFLIEFFRGDVDRGVYFNGTISSAQIVMIGYFALGLIGYQYCKRRKLPPPAALSPLP